MIKKWGREVDFGVELDFLKSLQKWKISPTKIKYELSGLDREEVRVKKLKSSQPPPKRQRDIQNRDPKKHHQDLKSGQKVPLRFRKSFGVALKVLV